MVQKILNLLKQPVAIVAILTIAMVVVGGAGYAFYQTQLPPEQPLEFPHNLHVGLGVQCLYCHPGALRGSSPGLPTVSKCWACHQQLTKYFDAQGNTVTPLTPRLQILKEYVDANKAIPWVPVAMVPDFVYFSHRPHIAGGLNCENCHGDLSKMTVAQNPQIFNMGFCLDCHRTKFADDPERLVKLTDCSTCHK